MKRIKVLSIFGARPEATKFAPLLLEFERHPEIESVVAVTAQHREMLDQVLNIFDIRPKYDLNIMKPSQSPYYVVSRAMELLEPILADERPDLVLVLGDTATVFIGALAAFYARIPVGHVEAGLRTYDINYPYPEEAYRRLVAPIAALHFCPTEGSRANLLTENVGGKMFVTGNTAIDLVRIVAEKENHVFKEGLLNKLDYSKRIILMTAHRRENYGEPLKNIMRAVNELTGLYSDVEFVFPMHKSPTVREAAAVLEGNKKVHLCEPLDVDDNINLMKKCYFIYTDSGGLQEEAPALSKPVVVLRNETERPEAVEAGTAVLAGTERDRIVAIARRLFDDAEHYKKMARAVNPYGDGRAAERIAAIIKHHFGLGELPEPFAP